MNDPIKTNVIDTEGIEQSCVLIEQFNNQNGGALYIFRIEDSGDDFTIVRSGKDWKHLNGHLPNEGCVQQLGNFLDQLGV